MRHRYLFKEFGHNQTEQDVNDWINARAAEEWEVVTFAAVPRVVGGGLIGGISLPAQMGSSYSVLMKRPEPLA